MGIERRPSRPSTGRHPQAGGASRSRTGRMGTSRSGAYPQPQKGGSTPVIIGVAAGVLLLIIIIAVAASSGGGTSAPPAPSNLTPPHVNVSAIENEGLRKCDEGLAMIESCGPLMSKGELSGTEKSQLKTKLTRGKMLIEQGMSKLDEAYEATKGKNKYSTRQYTQALINARKKLLEMK